MSVFNLLRSKLLGIDPLCSLVNGFREISHSSALGFNASPCLMAMPVKKKRKIDPAVLKLREERKKRKIEKEIRRLQKLTKTLRPIEETRMPLCLYKNAERRARNIKVTEDVEEKRIEIQKKWNKISSGHSQIINKDIMRIILSQEIALDELRKESVELYNAAIQLLPQNQSLSPEVYIQQLTKLKNAVKEKRLELTNRRGIVSNHDNLIHLSYKEKMTEIDPDFLPFSFEGPSETPPIEDYDIPDGDYSDISKKWLNE